MELEEIIIDDDFYCCETYFENCKIEINSAYDFNDYLTFCNCKININCDLSLNFGTTFENCEINFNNDFECFDNLEFNGCVVRVFKNFYSNSVIDFKNCKVILSSDANSKFKCEDLSFENCKTRINEVIESFSIIFKFSQVKLSGKNINRFNLESDLSFANCKIGVYCPTFVNADIDVEMYDCIVQYDSNGFIEIKRALFSAFNTSFTFASEEKAKDTFIKVYKEYTLENCNFENCDKFIKCIKSNNEDGVYIDDLDYSSYYNHF